MKLLVFFALALACVAAQDLLPGRVVVPEFGSRIINGNNAATGQFPYQVGMMVSTAQGSSWCGGSVIDPNWVLTAGHCVDGAYGATLYFGATNRNLPLKTMKVGSSNLFKHEKYNRRTIQNDIALIKLTSPLTFSSRIDAVALDTNPDNTYVGEDVLVSGWGLTSDRSRSVERYLKYTTNLDITKGSQCQRMFGRSCFTIKNICAVSSKGSSTCQGDSGGPLVRMAENISQVGIVSYGSAEGCERGLPFVFTRVASYISWIEQTTGVKFQ